MRFALNPLQWITVDGRWRYAEPGFRADYPGVLAQVRAAGFDAVMLEVLATQTLQDYARIIADAGLALAPGYCAVGLYRASRMIHEQGFRHVIVAGVDSYLVPATLRAYDERGRLLTVPKG